MARPSASIGRAGSQAPAPGPPPAVSLFRGPVLSAEVWLSLQRSGSRLDRNPAAPTVFAPQCLTT